MFIGLTQLPLPQRLPPHLPPRFRVNSAQNQLGPNQVGPKPTRPKTKFKNQAQKSLGPGL